MGSSSPNHRSVQALEADIRNWVKVWNENPKPFIWTKTAEQSGSLDDRHVAAAGPHRRVAIPKSGGGTLQREQPLAVVVVGRRMCAQPRERLRVQILQPWAAVDEQRRNWRTSEASELPGRRAPHRDVPPAHRREP